MTETDQDPSLDRVVMMLEDHGTAPIDGEQDPEKVAEAYQELGSWLEAHDIDNPDPGLELVVEFRQQFTVKPPANVDDRVYAEDWFWNIYPELGHDVVDTSKKGNYTVLSIRPAGFDD